MLIPKRDSYFVHKSSNASVQLANPTKKIYAQKPKQINFLHLNVTDRNKKCVVLALDFENVHPK